MADTASQFIEQWHRIVRSKDAEAISAILAPDVEDGGPAFWGKLPGKDPVAPLHHGTVSGRNITTGVWERQAMDLPKLPERSNR